MCTPIFIAALFITAKMWKQPKCPSTDEWIKKMWYVYTMEYELLSHKKRVKFCHITKKETEKKPQDNFL